MARLLGLFKREAYARSSTLFDEDIIDTYQYTIFRV
jgi:hypothetical protein